MKRIMMCFSIMFVAVSVAFAEPLMDGPNFDKDKNYEIHYQTNDNDTEIIYHAEILGFKSIGGRQFLVIDLEDPTHQREKGKGYVDFKRIITIVPARKALLNVGD